MTELNDNDKVINILKETLRVKDLRILNLKQEVKDLKDAVYNLEKEIGRLRDVLRSYEG
jgi:hypothetical protein